MDQDMYDKATAVYAEVMINGMVSEKKLEQFITQMETMVTKMPDVIDKLNTVVKSVISAFGFDSSEIKTIADIEKLSMDSKIRGKILDLVFKLVDF